MCHFLHIFYSTIVRYQDFVFTARQTLRQARAETAALSCRPDIQEVSASSMKLNELNMEHVQKRVPKKPGFDIWGIQYLKG
jgi:uncharacterized protein YqfB (UPF0267 family)